MSSPDRQPQVIFIDDESVVLEGIRRSLLLQNLGWDCAFISDPIAALNDKRALTCDVIVSDLRMPEMNGLELMKSLRAKGMSAEVIILTGTGDMTAALEAINDINAFRFYIKPCPQTRLTDGIKEAIAHRQASQAAADLLPFGVLALDAAKRITFMNKEGARLISQGDAIIMDGMGRFHAPSTTKTNEIYQAIDAVCASGDALVLGLDDRQGDTRYSVLLERAERNNGTASVFLFIMDPGRQSPPSLDALKHLFEFSNSEAKLAHGLAMGQDIREVADGMGVTIQTARTYLKALFDKTGTNRQAELVRVLITSVPPIGSIRGD